MFFAVLIFLAILLYASYEIYAHVQRYFSQGHGNRIFFDSPRTAIFLLAVICLDRIIYFFILPFGGVDSDFFDVVLSDIPMLCFFSIYTVIIIRWAEILHNRNNINTKIDVLKPLIIATNVAIYVIWILFIIVYFILKGTEGTVVDSCAVAELSTPAQVISLVYKVYFTILCCLIVIGLVMYGINLFLLIDRRRNRSGGERPNLKVDIHSHY